MEDCSEATVERKMGRLVLCFRADNSVSASCCSHGVSRASARVDHLRGFAIKMSDWAYVLISLPTPLPN